MNDEVLVCTTCHEEARIVRLGKSLLVLGHLRNRFPSHPVRLARQCADCGDTLPAAGNHPRTRCRSCHFKAMPDLMRRRFWDKLDRPDGESGCWLWPGKVDRDGYGHRRPHRKAYTYAHGPIPNDLVVRHTCDVPRCCNPKHLILGTQADNIADREARGRTARGARSGMVLHPESIRRGSASPQAQLTERDVDEIRERVSLGARHYEVAAAFGVARSTITAIIRGQTWSHYTPARCADDRYRKGPEEQRRQSGAREDAPLPNDDRHASRVKRAVPDRISSGTLQPSGERQSQRDPSPVPAVPMSAGRSTAGGG